MAGLPIFPSLVGVTFPVKRKGWIFDTNVQTAVSGKQTTLPRRITPVHTWELDFEVLRSRPLYANDPAYIEMQTLAGFYAGRFGRAYPFGYVAADDNAVVDQLFGAGNGTSKTFQLVRGIGGFVEPVFLPTDLPKIMVAGGAPLVLGTDYTLAVGGMVTFAAAPAAGAQLTWTGPYAWMCRFDQEGIDFSNFMLGLWSAEKVSFTSIIA